mmetsp:Transcript_29132/g.73235  ORF Transcript_29132/g.73235 Transcript_29132/m.73235 type:complete len:277 (-) Transcript_29132:28-858(-)|eukprot:CAMPEP_0177641412 /NCGR_PEP_ID=MMETSP0447-20121125/7050_1 /TAXON_ID=0 /ORGANISM="Stygamoeba regulata, Strain BSH-02190019" /LENGTH=276 /DNA_ID=CAMNT_0019143523 /DNA_START=54 /DNA_END=884 /DNA_ORIENTATION=-
MSDSTAAPIVTLRRQPPPQWQPDEARDSCNGCGVKFSFFNRRHHCRRDGQLYCGDCSRDEVTLVRQANSEPQRVCKACATIARKEEKLVREVAPSLVSGQLCYVHAPSKSEATPAILSLSSDCERVTWRSTQLVQNQAAHFQSMELSGLLEIRPATADDPIRRPFTGLDACLVLRTSASTLQVEATDRAACEQWLSGIRLAKEVLLSPSGSSGHGEGSATATTSMDEAARAAEERLREAERNEAEFLRRQQERREREQERREQTRTNIREKYGLNK